MGLSNQGADPMADKKKPSKPRAKRKHTVALTLAHPDTLFTAEGIAELFYALTGKRTPQAEVEASRKRLKGAGLGGGRPGTKPRYPRRGRPETDS